MRMKQRQYFKDFHFDSTSMYDELNIYEMSKSFGWYGKSYKVELIDSKAPLAQLEASKLSINDLFKSLKLRIMKLRVLNIK